MVPPMRVAACLSLVLAASMLGMPSAVQGVPVAPSEAGDVGNGTWQQLGPGLNNGVFDIVIAPDDTVYIAGGFTADGASQALKGIAAWAPDTGAFTPLGNGLNNSAATLLWDDDTLYVGGFFTAADGGPSLSRIAAWSPRTRSYSPLASGLSSGFVTVLKLLDDTLVVGGNFTSVAGGPTVNNITTWTDDTFRALGSGVSSEVDSILIIDDTLYLGGWFSTWTGGPANAMRYVGSWGPLGSGSPGYAPLGTGLNSLVFSLAAISDDTVLMSGQFTQSVGGVPLRNIAQWVPGSSDDSGYRPLGLGLDNRTDTVVVDDTRQLVYVGGLLEYACGDAACLNTNDDTVALNHIGVFDLRTQTWAGLADDSGVGLDGGVTTITLDDTGVYVGGFFSESEGGTSLGRIARWTWRPPSGTVDVTGDPGDAVTILGQGFIGVDAVTIGGQPAVIDYSASSSTALTVTLPGSLAGGTYPITVTAVGGTATLTAVAVVGSTPVPPPAPVPASAPRDVSVASQGLEATVSWSAPATSGSYPVTTYQVVALPSGRSCLTTSLTCTVTGLPLGVAQSVRVRALTGAGWGAWSDAVPVVSIRLSGVREGRRIALTGSTTGVGMGAIVTVWIDAGRGPREMRRTALVGMDGSFTWAKRLNRDVPVRVYVTVGENRSNAIRLTP